MGGFGRGAAWLAAALGGLAIGCSDGVPEPETPGGATLAAGAEAEGAAPEIQRLRLEPAEPLPGDRVRAVVMARDPDGDRVELGYRWSVAGRPVSGDGAEITLPDLAKGDPIEVEVIASDGTWESEPVRAAVEVRNRRPLVVGVRLEPTPTVAPGDKVVALAVGEDEDEDEIEYEYQWRVNGRSVDAEGPSLDTASLAHGDEIQVRVTASDGDAESDPVESVVVRVGNASPEILSDPSGFREDGLFAYSVEARDPDGDRNLRYSLRQAPEGMQVDPILGEVSWRPTPEQTGRHTVEVVVQDREGASTVQRFELDVAVAEEPKPAAPAP